MIHLPTLCSLMGNAVITALVSRATITFIARSFVFLFFVVAIETYIVSKPFGELLSPGMYFACPNCCFTVHFHGVPDDFFCCIKREKYASILLYFNFTGLEFAPNFFKWQMKQLHVSCNIFKFHFYRVFALKFRCDSFCAYFQILVINFRIKVQV